MKCRRFLEWLERHGCRIENRSGSPAMGADTIVLRRGSRSSEMPAIAPDAQIDSDLVQKVLIDLDLDLADLPDLSRTMD